MAKKWRRKGKTPQELRDPPAAFSLNLYAMGGVVALPSADGRTLNSDSLTINVQTRDGHCIHFWLREREGKCELVLAPGETRAYWLNADEIPIPLPLSRKGVMEAFSAMLVESLKE